MNSRPYVLGVFSEQRDASKALRRAVALQGKAQRSEAEEAELMELAGKLGHLSADCWLDLVAEALSSPLGLHT